MLKKLRSFSFRWVLDQFSDFPPQKSQKGRVVLGLLGLKYWGIHFSQKKVFHYLFFSTGITTFVLVSLSLPIFPRSWDIKGFDNPKT